MQYLLAQTPADLPGAVEKGVAYVLATILAFALIALIYLFVELRKSDRALGDYAKEAAKEMNTLNREMIPVIEQSRTGDAKVIDEVRLMRSALEDYLKEQRDDRKREWREADAPRPRRGG